MAASPRAPAAFVGELRSLIATQKNNYRDYLTVLGGEKSAAEKDDDDRFDLYRKLEMDGRERIVGTERSLQSLFRELERTGAAAADSADLAVARDELEALRLEALEAIASTRTSVERKKDEVKRELDALSATLRRLSGGRGFGRTAGDDPQFIDMYS